MGDERAKLLAKILQMSLTYQFVTPLTSMTMKGMTDEDGLEPIIDKPPDGTGSAEGEAGGQGEASEGRKPPGLQFCSLPLPSRFSALG